MYTTIKSIIDRVLAVTGLILLSPLSLSLAIAIKLDSKGSVLKNRNPQNTF